MPDKSFNPELSSEKKDWLEQVNKDLKGKDFNATLTTENKGIKIKPLYTSVDLPHFAQDEEIELEEDLDDDLAAIYTGSGDRLLTWSISEEMHVPDTGKLNDIVLASVSRGANCIRLTADNDKQWETFFDEIFTLEYPAPFILHCHTDITEENIVNIWRERIGFMGSRDTLINAIEFDPVSYWLEKGKIENESKTINNLSEIYFRLTAHMQDCKLIKIDTQQFAEKGNTPAQQLAYAMGIATYYFDILSKKHIPPEDLLHLLSFRFSAGSDYFMEIAKLRAFKILWTNLIKAFAPSVDFIRNPYMHVCLSNTSADTENPYDNLYRLTTQAMSAVLGECDVMSIATDNIKESNAANLIMAVQTILRYESSFDIYRDAANGSFYIESLTTQLAEQAWHIFQQMETEGGFMECWKKGNIK